MLVLCQKLHISTYDRQIFFRWLAFLRWPLGPSPQSGGARTAPVSPPLTFRPWYSHIFVLKRKRDVKHQLTVCLSARISQKPHDRTSPKFWACCVWFGPPLTESRYVMYFRFCGWRPMFAHNGLYLWCVVHIKLSGESVTAETMYYIDSKQMFAQW